MSLDVVGNRDIQMVTQGIVEVLEFTPFECYKAALQQEDPDNTVPADFLFGYFGSATSDNSIYIEHADGYERWVFSRI